MQKLNTKQIELLENMPKNQLLEMLLYLFLKDHLKEEATEIFLAFLTTIEQKTEMVDWLKENEQKKPDFQTIWFKAEEIEEKYPDPDKNIDDDED